MRDVGWQIADSRWRMTPTSIRRYKQDFVRFLVYALASLDETTDHLETLFDTESLRDGVLYDDLHSRLTTLGAKLNKFLSAVEAGHISPK